MVNVSDDRVGSPDSSSAGVARTRISAAPTSTQTQADFLLQVELGQVEGFELIDRTGWNGAISPSTPEDVWASGGEMVWPTAAETIEVVSGDANDSVAGTGAQRVVVEGLDASWEPLTEEVDLSGTTAVTTTGAFLRINRAWISHVGTYHGANAGVISMSGTTSSNNYGQIAVGQGETKMARYSVPAGRAASLVSYSIQVSTPDKASIEGRATRGADAVVAPFGTTRAFVRLDSLSGNLESSLKAILPEKTDIYWSVPDVSSAGTGVSVRFVLLLQDIT